MIELGIDDVKPLAAKGEFDGGIFIGIDFDGGQYQTTSFGRDRRLCRKMAQIAEDIEGRIDNGQIEI